MKKVRLLFSVVLILAGINNIITAQVKIKCQISTDTLMLGNVLDITFVAENAEVRFEAPEFAGSPMISGPNISQSMSIINGKTSSVISYNYKFKPEVIGSIFVEPSSFISENTTYEIPPFEIIVTPNPNGKLQRRNTIKTIYSNQEEIGNSITDSKKKRKRKKIKL